MQGLIEAEDQTLVFDKPDGRIIESFAVLVDHTPAEVLQYYGTVLPQFGWQKVQKGHFKRGAETLVLELGKRDGRDILRVLLSPS